MAGGAWGARVGGRWQPRPPLAVFKHIQTQLIKDTQIDPLKSSSLRKAFLWLHRSPSPHPPSGALGSGGAMSPLSASLLLPCGPRACTGSLCPPAPRQHREHAVG